MRKNLFFLILIIMLTSCSPNNSSNSLPDDFNKKVSFEECFGDSDGATVFCFEFMIEVLEDSEVQQIKYSIDGSQTFRRLICDISRRNDEYRITFNSYDQEDIHYSEDFTKDEMVFVIVKKDNNYYAKNFKSPYDDLLIEKEYLLSPR